MYGCKTQNIYNKVNTASNGADHNLKTNDGWTPLMIACQKGHSDVV